MAKAEGTNGAGVTSQMEPIPEGFDPVGFSGKLMFAVKSPGAIVRGVLVGYMHKKGLMKANAFQIKLTMPCMVSEKTEKGAKASTRTAQPGEVVSVDDSKALEDLRKFTADGGRYEVYIKYIEQQPLANGQSFWLAQVAKKILSAPPAPVAGDKIPF